MPYQFSVLEEKVDRVLAQLDELKAENIALKEENSELRSELVKIKRDFESLKLTHTDRSNQVKTKLVSVLNRLEELEATGS